MFSNVLPNHWEWVPSSSQAPKINLVYLYNCTGFVEKTLESPLDCKEIQPVHPSRRSVLGVHWKDWCWSWNSNTLATSCEELTHWKRPWCWEGLGARGEGDDGGWDGWMASPTRWTWVWVNSGSWWWTGRPGVLRFMGSQRVRHDWATELNWTELNGFVRRDVTFASIIFKYFYAIITGDGVLLFTSQRPLSEWLP